MGVVGDCVEATICDEIILCEGLSGALDVNAPEQQNHPVACVDQREAARYCEWIGGRLPTESEWEYAAAGSISCPFGGWYPWGSELIDGHYANFKDEFNPFQASEDEPVTAQGGPTTPVGFFDGSLRERENDGWIDGPATFQTENNASVHGIYDMAGNLAEWTLDCWHENYEGAPTDGSAWLSDGESCQTAVKKGEGWSDSASALYTWFRAPKERTTEASYMGFRCTSAL